MNASGSPPNIGPTAAPGVAFNYRYAFRLEGQRIAAVQERHAEACEKLGLSRCRITGMRYRLAGEEEIAAMLSFKLDPSIARQFGKNAIAAVTEAKGMLVDSEISGEDAGAAIQAAARSEAELTEDLRRIEAQLARPGLRSEERARLEVEAQHVRQSIRAQRANREDKQESLATTPMVFHYGSGELVPGFDSRNSLASAFDRAGENFLAGLGIMLIVLISILPWALLILLIWWLARRFGPRVGLPRPDTIA